MAFERGENSLESILSEAQNATISALNAREAGRTVEPFTLTPDIYKSINGKAWVEGYLKKERKSIELALRQLERVTAGTLPIRIKRTPDIEPFFLP